MTDYYVSVTVELVAEVEAGSIVEARELGLAKVRALPGVHVDDVLAVFTRTA